MRKSAPVHLRLIAVIGALTLALGAGNLFAGERTGFWQPRAASEDTPVVLELFTSEERPSRPPADELLSRIGALTPGVIPLAYHVDYWDSLGWSDPFSSSQWTMRQVEYVRAMQPSGSYTPQIVINGRWQCVGSDPNLLTRAIATARATPPPGVVTVRAIPPAAGSHKLNVSVSAHIVRTAGDKSLIVVVAIDGERPDGQDRRWWRKQRPSDQVRQRYGEKNNSCVRTAPGGRLRAGERTQRRPRSVDGNSTIWAWRHSSRTRLRWRSMAAPRNTRSSKPKSDRLTAGRGARRYFDRHRLSSWVRAPRPGCRTR